jgi:Flp pilus assembly protein CpaB
MRSIRPQTVTLLVLAILFALAAAITAKSFLMNKTVVVTPPPPPDLVEVLVWQSNLPANARVRDSDVAVKSVPHSMDKPGVVRIAQQVRGRILKNPVGAAGPVFLKDFYDMDKEKPPTLGDSLPPGHDLISVRIDDPVFSPTMVPQGSFIDIALTIDRPDEDNKDTILLAHAIQVVSPPVTDGGVPNVVNVSRDGRFSLWVAATPKETARLTLGQQSGGKISVTLCSAGDKLEIPSDQTASYDLDLKKLLGIKTPVVPDPPPEPQVTVVTEIRGTQVTRLVFDDKGDPIEQAGLEAAARKIASADALASATAGSKGTTPPKRCLKCEEEARKRALKRNGGIPPPPSNGVPTPAGSPTT